MAMISEMFSVYDSKAEVYAPVIQFRTKNDAIRWVGDMATDKNNPIGRHPEDHVLFHLGSFDDSNAGMAINPAPISLGVAIEFMQKG